MESDIGWAKHQKQWIAEEEERRTMEEVIENGGRYKPESNNPAENKLPT